MKINQNELRPLTYYLKENSINNPEKLAIMLDEVEITYKQLNQVTNSFASYLLREVSDKKVGLFLGNSIEFIVSYYSILKAGYTVCPINPMFKEYELEYQLNDLNCETIILHESSIDLLRKVIHNTKINKCIVIGDQEEQNVDNVSCINFNKCINFTTDQETLENINIDMNNDIALIMYTSGSSGSPKGAMLSYKNCSFKTACVVENFQMLDDNVSAIMPINHIAGMLVGLNSPIMSNSTIVLFEKYDKEKLDRLIKHNQITFLYTTPVMNTDLLTMNDSPVSSELKINIGTSFGSKITEKLSNKWENIFGIPYYEFSYGMTEGHTGNTLMPKNAYKYGTHGKPAHDTKIIIVDDSYKELKYGELGQILLKSPSVFKGYLNDPDKTAGSFHDGYFLTGDLGRIDEEGYLIYEGRLKELIKTSGFSVFPEEVESILNKHRSIEKSAVIGVENKKKGEVVKAFIIKNEELTKEELLNWCKENITYYKVPREIEFLDELPETSTGKLLRRKLRDDK